MSTDDISNLLLVLEKSGGGSFAHRTVFHVWYENSSFVFCSVDVPDDIMKHRGNMCGRIGNKWSGIHFIAEIIKSHLRVNITIIRHGINIAAGYWTKAGENRPHGFLEVIGLVGSEEAIHASRSFNIEFDRLGVLGREQCYSSIKRGTGFVKMRVANRVYITAARKQCYCTSYTGEKYKQVEDNLSIHRGNSMLLSMTLYGLVKQKKRRIRTFTRPANLWLWLPSLRRTSNAEPTPYDIWYTIERTYKQSIST